MGEVCKGQKGRDLHTGIEFSTVTTHGPQLQQ